MIWKAIDIIGLLLIAGIFGLFTWLMGTSVLADAQALFGGGGLAPVLMGLVLVHVVALTGLICLSSAIGIGYRATH